MEDSPRDPGQEDTPQQEFEDDMQAVMSIYHAGLLDHLEIPELARRWIEELNTLAISGNKSERRFLDDLKDRMPSEDSRAVRLEGGQGIRLRFDKSIRSQRGSQRILVLSNSQRTHVAMIAALTVLEGRAIKPTDVREFLRRVQLGDEWPVFNIYEALQFSRSWRFTYTLLKYYRPEIEAEPDDNDFPPEKLEMMHKTYEHIYEVLQSVRRLMDFLEYGGLDRNTRPGVEAAERDMSAAVLRDVEDLTYNQIAEEMGIEISEAARIKNDSSTVRQSVRRGRKILELAYGEQGWREMAQTLRDDAERWRSLSDEERLAEQVAHTPRAEYLLMTMLRMVAEMREDLL